MENHLTIYEQKQEKLELTWIGKNNPEYDIANIEPRILEERIDLSHGDKDTENMIIHGDNLLALKALLPGIRRQGEMRFYKILHITLVMLLNIMTIMYYIQHGFH